MICDIKTSPIHPYMEYLCIVVVFINELAWINEKKVLRKFRIPIKNSTRNGENQRQTFSVIGGRKKND